METTHNQLRLIETHLEDEIAQFEQDHPHANPLGNDEERRLARMLHLLNCALSDIRCVREVMAREIEENKTDDVEIGGEA